MVDTYAYIALVCCDKRDFKDKSSKLRQYLLTRAIVLFRNVQCIAKAQTAKGQRNDWA